MEDCSDGSVSSAVLGLCCEVDVGGIVLSSWETVCCVAALV